MERRLAAILAADVVGYTRLMGVNEAGTLRRLTELREKILEPLITEHHGRIVNLMGDGLLVEFASAVDSVSCAMAWQSSVARHEAESDASEVLQFRIGINLGDVIAEDDDIHGDGVNIASRLEGLAEPGGICLSDDIYRHAKGKVEAQFEDIGEQDLKNVADPVRVYRVVAARPAATPSATTDEPLPLPDKPSIAVLPFDNLSDDRAQQYLVDGIVEDIITELSRFKELFVIARNSTFAYKGQSRDVRQIADELGVRYIMEGSIRRLGNRVRVVAQLLDSASGSHVWAEKYDRDLKDVFALQEEITHQVVSGIAPQIELAELERSRSLSDAGLTAYELALQAQSLAYDATRMADPDVLEQAMSAIEAALKLDTRNVHALWTKCLVHFYRHMYRWGADPDGELVLFSEIAEDLIRIDSTNAKSYMLRAWAYLYQKKFDAALADHHRALTLNPNLAANLFAMAWSEAVAGLATKAREHAQLALRLSPRETDVWLGEGYAAMATASFMEGDFSETVRWGHLANQLQPVLQGLMVAANAYIGDLESAKSHAKTLEGFAPEFVSGVLAHKVEVFKLPEHNELFTEGLRKGCAPLVHEQSQ